MPENRRQPRCVPDKHLKVFDHDSNEYIGILANFSTEGVMFVTRDKMQSHSATPCRVELPQSILDRNEIVFEAHHLWSRKNVKKGWWESGYKIKANKINKEMLSYLSVAYAVGKWKIHGVVDASTVAAENLRKTTRYEVRDQYPVYQQTSYHEIGTLVDLSVVGSSFITPKPVKRGTLLNCKVKLPKTIFRRDYLFFDAECMWCKEDGDTGEYLSGYKLLNVSEHDNAIILHLLLHHLDERETEQKDHIVDAPAESQPIRVPHIDPV